MNAIPKKLKIGRSWYTVHTNIRQRKPILGKTYYKLKTIEIAPLKRHRSYLDLYDTFWHEVTHAVLHEMQSPLYRNEQFVQQFSGLLNKAIMSARF